MTLVAFLTSTTFSQTLPAWESKGDLACYDLEGAKALKHYELTCQECTYFLQLRAEKLTLCSSEAKKREEAYDLVVKNNEELTSLLAESDRLLHQSQRLLESSEAWSLRGSALPWAIAGGLALFVGGLVVGISK